MRVFAYYRATRQRQLDKVRQDVEDHEHENPAETREHVQDVVGGTPHWWVEGTDDD